MPLWAAKIKTFLFRWRAKEEPGCELRSVAAFDCVEEVREVGGGADAVVGDEGAVLRVVDIAGMDELGAAEDFRLGVGANLGLPADVRGLVTQAQLLGAGVGPADVGTDRRALKLTLGDADLVGVDVVGLTEEAAVRSEEEAAAGAGVAGGGGSTRHRVG